MEGIFIREKLFDLLGSRALQVFQKVSLEYITTKEITFTSYLLDLSTNDRKPHQSMDYLWMVIS